MSGTATALREKAQRIRVGAAPLTYSPGTSSEGISFFRDMVSDTVQARERLDRHAQETAESRDVTSAGGGAGFMPPGYLAAEYAAYSRYSRPVADIVPNFPMPPSGTTFNVPALTGGTAVDIHADNAAVPNTDITSSLTNEQHSVVSIAGAANVSRASWDRSYPGLDTIIYQDLAAALGEKLDAQVLNGTGSGGQHTGIRTVSGVNTVTVSSATAKDIMVGILQGASKMAKTRFRWPTHCILHPSTYAFLLSDSGTASLIERDDDSLGGIQYVLDAQVGTSYNTNQSEAYLVYAPDFRLAESESFVFADDPLAGVAEIKFTMYSYSLFAYRFPKSITVCSGAGFAAQSGF